MFKHILAATLAIALPLASCQSEPQASADPAPTPTVTPVPTPTPEVDYYKKGLEQGKAAAVAAGTAHDKESWQGVVDGWD